MSRRNRRDTFKIQLSEVLFIRIDAEEIRDDIITDPKAFYSYPRTAEQIDTVAHSLSGAMSIETVDYQVVDDRGRIMNMDIVPNSKDESNEFALLLSFDEEGEKDYFESPGFQIIAAVTFSLDIDKPETFDPSAGRWCGITRADAEYTALVLTSNLESLWDTAVDSLS